MSVIKFRNVNKSFRIYKNKANSLKEQLIVNIFKKRKLEVEEYKVLENINFDIEKGETIGIIGQNGAGKSTTLKLIAKILYPDTGEIEVKGKISSLIEVGAGFHPDLSGRENVYLYASIIGVSKKEVDERYDDIVKFAEIEEFMDSPVKNYSSGMYMRLAFSVSVHVDPEILLIDEVLAVGDANFQEKCINKIQEFKKKGKTIVFVSHDMNAIKLICDRVFFIHKGGKMVQGTTDEMIKLYNEIGHE